MLEAFRTYIRLVDRGEYPAAEHNYEMPGAEKRAVK
jgi:ketopantoate hydroxymethyltransferase